MPEFPNVTTGRIVRLVTKKGDHLYYGPYADAEEAVRKANDLVDAIDSLEELDDAPIGYEIFYLNIPKED